jgi:hypothetical protein
MERQYHAEEFLSSGQTGYLSEKQRTGTKLSALKMKNLVFFCIFKLENL